MRAAAAASFSRVSGVPRLPHSPRVRSTRATRDPRAAWMARVPPITSSASSGCAQMPTMSKSLPAATHHLLVEPLVLRHHAVGAEEALRAAAGAPAHLAPALGVLQELDRAMGHAVDVAHRQQVAGLRVPHHL